MDMSRRLALGCASAFAAMGGTTQTSLASVLKIAAKASLSGSARNSQTAQRFIELLIHQDEAKGARYTATFWLTAPDTAWFDICSLEESQYRVTNHNYKKHGYRLRRVSAFATKEGIRYAALWELAAGPAWESTHAMPLAKFETAQKDFKQSGYRMTHIDARENYAAIWEKGDNTTQQVFTALTLLEYEQQYATLTAQGLRPYRISATTQGGAPIFAAIFDKASASVAWQAQHQMTAAELATTNKTAMASGYRLVDASGHMLGGKPSFSGIWEKAS
jgi:hypothetical protein